MENNNQSEIEKFKQEILERLDRLEEMLDKLHAMIYQQQQLVASSIINPRMKDKNSVVSSDVPNLHWP